MVLNPKTNVVDMSALQKGFYMVNIITPEKTLFKRIIKE
jgi:hypothetical protein